MEDDEKIRKHFLTSELMKDRLIIFILIVIQLILCFSVITLFPISMDEPFSIFHSQQSIHELLTIFSNSNNPPLHFFALKFWIDIFGISPLAVRSLSVFISLISITVLYKMGRKLWKKEYAIVLVGLFMFSRLNHFTAMEARMYGLFTLFFILIMKDLYALLVENKKVFIQLGIWNALLFYSHYLAGTIMVMEFFILLLFYKKWTIGKWLQGIGVLFVTALLLFPILRVFFSRVSDFSENGTWVAEPKLVDLWTNLVKLMNNEFAFFVSLALLVSLPFIHSKLKFQKNKGDDRSKYYLIWFLGAYLFFFAISILVQPIFIAKYLQFLTIPLFFVIVHVIARYDITEKWKYLHFVILIPFILSFKPVPDLNRETDKLVEFVKSEKTENTVVYYCPPHYEFTLAYHYDQAIFKRYNDLTESMKNVGFYPIYNAGDMNEEKAIDKIIYIDFDSQFLYDDNNGLAYLNEHHSFLHSKTFKGNFNVYCYSF